MKNLRKFQRELQEAGRKVACGDRSGKVTRAAITPGGGKTFGAELFARELLTARSVDYVVWLVPRASLVEQVAGSFRGLRPCDNTAPLVRGNPGEVGYVATFQAVYSNPDLHAHFASRHRVLLVVDEGHHLPEHCQGVVDREAAWTRAVEGIARSAAHVLVMSGTLYRHDRRRIAFMDYVDNKPRVDVAYSRRDALAEGSKVPIHFEWLDAPTEWRLPASQEIIETTVAKSDPIPERSMAWDLAGHEQFFRQATDRTVRAWAKHRAGRIHKDRPQLLLVVKDQAVARAVYDCAKTVAPWAKIGLAVSDEGADAKRDIKRFRDGKIDALVTVGMAYEGMDAPRITHIGCLTGFRSVPWIEQCLDRGSRIDWIASGVKNHDKSKAVVFAPRDPLMVRAAEMIESEQVLAAADPGAQQERAERDQSGEQNDAVASFFVLDKVGAVVGGEDCIAGLRVRVQAVFPWAADLPDDAVVTLAARGVLAEEPPPEAAESEVFDFDEEARLRRLVEGLARKNDRDRGYEKGTTNKLIVRRWNKRRNQMTVSDLRDVARALQGGM